MVILTLTTIPSRLNSIYPKDIKYCLNSLLNQTYSNYEIHLNIPSTFKHTGEKYIIPDWLVELQKTNNKLKVFTELEDLGPVTKLFYTIDRCTDPEDIIIVVDDDLIYRDTLVEVQVNNQEKHIDAVVGYDGIDSVDGYYEDIKNYYCSGTRDHNKVKIIQHYKSVSYRRRYFEKDFKSFILDNLSWNDDLLVSTYFAKKKRDRISTYHETDRIPKDEDEWRTIVGTTFPLVEHTQHERYEGCNLYRNLEIDDKKDTLYRILDNGYYEDKLENLQTVIYTNDTSIPLAELALAEFIEYAPKEFNPTIVTNQIPEEVNLTYKDNIFNANIPNNKGLQFSSVMVKYLRQINTKYIFFILDDYITYRRFSKHDFNKVLTLMDNYDVDYFSLDKKQEHLTRGFKVFENNIYDYGLINVISSEDLHRFSVQPCIWNRESLINLLEKYPNIGIHILETDKTIVKENLLTLGFNWHVFEPKIPRTEGFEHHFLYSWAEIVRHGVFHVPENGFARNKHDVPVQLVYKLIDKYDLRSKKEFKKLLHNL